MSKEKLFMVFGNKKKKHEDFFNGNFYLNVKLCGLNTIKYNRPFKYILRPCKTQHKRKVEDTRVGTDGNFRLSLELRGGHSGPSLR